MPTPTKSELFLRERLKVLRKGADLTQFAVSELAGISYDYYKDIEQGVRPNVSLRMIEQIGAVYGLTIRELFAEELPTIKLKSKPVPPPHYKKRKKST